MTKIAMIRVNNDKELKDLGFKLLICVHDELIGECPEENKDTVADRLCYLMRTSVENDVCVPFKCDPTIEYSWYLSDYTDVAQKDYNKLIDKGVVLSCHIDVDAEGFDALAYGTKFVDGNFFERLLGGLTVDRVYLHLTGTYALDGT